MGLWLSAKGRRAEIRPWILTTETWLYLSWNHLDFSITGASEVLQCSKQCELGFFPNSNILSLNSVCTEADATNAQWLSGAHTAEHLHGKCA